MLSSTLSLISSFRLSQPRLDARAFQLAQIGTQQATHKVIYTRAPNRRIYARISSGLPLNAMRPPSM